MTPKLIVPVDTSSYKKAIYLAEELKDSGVDMLKVGLQLFIAQGQTVLNEFQEMGFDIMLDLKLHDIPATASGAIQSMRGLDPKLITIHASGGREMMMAAKMAADIACPTSKLLAVTILTSLDGKDIKRIGYDPCYGPKHFVGRMALEAKESNIDGVVCSPQEAHLIPEGLIRVCPAIRLDKEQHDQKRVMTHLEAAEQGIDYIVVGRPITQHPYPARVVKRIKDDFKNL